jgi:hypothetical protein
VRRAWFRDKRKNGVDWWMIGISQSSAKCIQKLKGDEMENKKGNHQCALCIRGEEHISVW